MPLLLCGASPLPCGLFQQVDNERIKKIHCTSVRYRCYCCKYLPNGGIQWLLVKPWTFSTGQCVRYHTTASRWPSERPAKAVCFIIAVCLSVAWLSERPAKVVCFIIVVCLFVCLLPCWLPGQYGASSCPMGASRGFWYSPGHAALGDTCGVAPTPPHGHRNGQ